MEKSKLFFWIAVAGFIVAVASVAISAIAGLGTRFELFDFRAGLQLLQVSAIVAVIAAAVSVVGIVGLLFMKPKKGLVPGLAGLVIGIVFFSFPLSMLFTGMRVPAIHDITTDTSDPPQFAAILPLRMNAPNSPVYGGADISALQEKAYPEVKPLQLALSPDQAFQKALDLVNRKGWQVVSTVPALGTIEATDTTLWMGFKDDIVIRIKAEGSGSRVDMRSESRVGKGDFGTNAKRINAFLADLQKAAG